MSQREYHIVVLGSGELASSDQLEQWLMMVANRWSRKKLSNRYVADVNRPTALSDQLIITSSICTKRLDRELRSYN